MGNNPYAVKKPIWLNIIFFSITTLGAVVGVPLYLYHVGMTWSLFALFMFYMVATGLGITVGYHRHFSHATYKTHPIVQFILLFFGAAAFEQTALAWSSQHRDHHLYVDTDKDPYSIKKGFWYAHIGWLLFWEHRKHYENVKDLQKNKMVMHQHNNYLLWSVGSGIVLPVIIGALMGQALGAFIFAVCTRITLVYHSTFFINSICHMFGKSTYDIHATAKDHWLIAFLTYGEGYHNFHHRFPSDYRNGVRWYQWDPSKWVIALLEKVGLASGLCRVSDFSILSAEISAENRKACEELQEKNSFPQMTKALNVMKVQYDGIRSSLTQWEAASREYREALTNHISLKSDEIRKSAFEKMEAAKVQFAEAHQSWRQLVDKKPIDLYVMLLGLSA